MVVKYIQFQVGTMQWIEIKDGLEPNLRGMLLLIIKVKLGKITVMQLIAHMLKVLLMSLFCLPL